MIDTSMIMTPVNWFSVYEDGTKRYGGTSMFTKAEAKRRHQQTYTAKDGSKIYWEAGYPELLPSD